MLYSYGNVKRINAMQDKFVLPDNEVILYISNYNKSENL